MSNRLLVFALTLLVLGLTPGVSQATIAISLGNGPPNTTLGYEPGANSTTAIGHLLGNGPNVLQFVSNTALIVPSNGQAEIAAAGTNFTTFTITPVAGILGFSGLELNPGATASGTFTVTATDQFNLSFGATFPLDANGQNRFFAVASGGEVITSLTVTASGALINDVKQIRIGDVVLPTPAVPEPGTLALAASGLVALGVVGAGRARRRSSPAPAPGR